MTHVTIANLIYLVLILYVLYFVVNKTSESFTSTEDSTKLGTKECSRAAVNDSVSDYIFNTRHSTR